MQPPKLSPIHAHHVAHHAVIETYAGWRIPERYREPDHEIDHIRKCAGLIDRSDVAKIDLKGTGIHEWIARTFDADVAPQGGCPFSLPGSIRGLFLRLRDDRGWVIVPAQNAVEAMDDLLTDEVMHVTDITSVYAAVQLIGPHSLRVLHKLTSLDLRPSRFPALACTQGSVARVPALVFRDDMGELPAYWLFVTRDYGEFVWETVCHAGEEYDLRPTGFAAYRQLTS